MEEHPLHPGIRLWATPVWVSVTHGSLRRWGVTEWDSGCAVLPYSQAQKTPEEARDAGLRMLDTVTPERMREARATCLERAAKILFDVPPPRSLKDKFDTDTYEDDIPF
jgi:hypothetical protein